MPSRLSKVKEALQKRLEGPLADPEVRQAYEAEKKKGIVEGAKAAGRRQGRQIGAGIAKRRGTGVLDRLGAGAEFLDKDIFGGPGLDVDVGKLDLIGGPEPRRTVRKRAGKRRKGTTIRVNGTTIGKKKKRRKSRAGRQPASFNPLDW